MREQNRSWLVVLISWIRVWLGLRSDETTGNPEAVADPERFAALPLAPMAPRPILIDRPALTSITSSTEEISLVDARFQGTHGQPLMNTMPLIHARRNFQADAALRLKEKSTMRRPRSTEDDTPPTPRGCQWQKTESGWNLWRFWSEKDPVTGERVRKTRYAGFLSQEAWQIMKDYDYETFVSIIGQRLRRYGQR